MSKLTLAWDDFIVSKKIEGASLSLLKNTYTLEEENKVVIKLKNSLETSLLSKVEPDLVRFLRNTLQNDYLIISYDLSLEKTSQKAYTSAEIFNEMVEKNPDLLKLKEALGLDTEY